MKLKNYHFDRTWYGRVLVERVEGFASPIEWQRAYDEINRFEKDLFDSQTIVVKFGWQLVKMSKSNVLKPEKRHRTNALKLLPKIGVTVISGMII